MEKFRYQAIFSPNKSTPDKPGHNQETKFRLIGTEGVSVQRHGDREILCIEPRVLSHLAEIAFDDVSHLLRTSHLEKVSKILKDPEASENDRFVATELLRNATIAADRTFPSCQDTGTAIVMGKKGEDVYTGVDDAQYLSQGIYDTYQKRNLRYSQLAPISMYVEKNTGNNLPAQIDLYTKPGRSYEFLFIAKGGGSANKSYLFQKTKSLLNPTSMAAFVKEALLNLGTAACPPYHLALVIGGTSAELNLKTVKLASCGYYDNLPNSGNADGQAFRDLEMEKEVEKWGIECGIGAQFGGKYFLHDVRVIRLPRHGASCPVGIGVSCSADRQILGKITDKGYFIEQLEDDPARFLPANLDRKSDAIRIDLRHPMSEIRAELSKHPIATRIMLDGPLIVARDIAHAKINEILQSGRPLPDYIKNHPVYYAGPAKTPEGHPSGSFGPTTSERMDPYVERFQQAGGSLVMLGKGNRTPNITDSCQRYGGFYLGSVGGPAARLGKDCIKKIEVLEFPELGMEAVWKIEVKDFPAFIVIDDKGNDFFRPKR